MYAQNSHIYKIQKNIFLIQILSRIQILATKYPELFLGAAVTGEGKMSLLCAVPLFRAHMTIAGNNTSSICSYPRGMNHRTNFLGGLGSASIFYVLRELPGLLPVA